jgi:NAD-dependent deacetylase
MTFMDSTRLAEAVKLLRQAKKVTVFTGAGISAESSIPTFRDDAGLWKEFPPERFAHWKGLMQEAWRSPSSVARFVLAVLEPIAKALPNPAHRAIAQLADKTTVTVITQNIDNLHQEAGSLRVREVHGSLFKIIDSRGTLVRRLSKSDLLNMVDQLKQLIATRVTIIKLLRSFRDILGLGLRGVTRPSIVLFHDDLAQPDWSQATEDTEWCDLMIVVGTSAQVYPACMLPVQARLRNVPLIEINPGNQEFDSVWLEGKAAEELPRLTEAAFR